MGMKLEHSTNGIFTKRCLASLDFSFLWHLLSSTKNMSTATLLMHCHASYIVGESVIVRGWPCSAIDGIHMIVLVNLVLFLIKLYGSMHIKQVVQMSYRIS